MHKLNHSLTLCQNYKLYARWAGDIRVGKCLHDIGVRVESENGFHHEPDGRYDKGFVLEPISFHHLSVDSMAFYFRMTVVEDRGPYGELYRWDFSRFFLHEYVLKQRRTRFRFGHSVKFARGIGLSQQYTIPVYFRNVDDQNFHMQIAKTPRFGDGDNCIGHTTNPWLLPNRKSVLVNIQCEGETDVDRIGEIRSMRRLNGCITEIKLALLCPRRQTIFAEHLSIGTSLGSDDIVRMGQPRKCASNRRNQSSAPIFGGTPARFHISLSRDELALVQPTLVVDSALCFARFIGDGVVVSGGLLYAAKGEVLQITCTCARQARLATINVTLTLMEYTSPTWSYLQNCPMH